MSKRRGLKETQASYDKDIFLLRQAQTIYFEESEKSRARKVWSLLFRVLFNCFS